MFSKVLPSLFKDSVCCSVPIMAFLSQEDFLRAKTPGWTFLLKQHESSSLRLHAFQVFHTQVPSCDRVRTCPFTKELNPLTDSEMVESCIAWVSICPPGLDAKGWTSWPCASGCGVRVRPQYQVGFRQCSAESLPPDTRRPLTRSKAGESPPVKAVKTPTDFKCLQNSGLFENYLDICK